MTEENKEQVTEDLHQEELPLTVEVETVKDNTKKFHIAIQQETVQGAFNEEYRRIRREETVPGFRRGKAPVKLIAARYSHLAKGAVIQELVQQYLPDVFKVADETPMGLPDMGETPEINENGELVFQFTVECEPKLDPIAYKQVEVHIPKLDADQALEKHLQTLQDQHAEYLPLENVPLAEGHYCHFILSGTVDGTPLGEDGVWDHEFVLGERDPLPKTPLVELLEGRKVGDSFAVDFMIPEDSVVTALAGKKLVGTVRVLEVKEIRRPEIDDVFLAEHFEEFEGTAEEFKEAERKKIEERLNEERDVRILSGLVPKILAANPFELSAAVVEPEVQHQAAEFEISEKDGNYELLRSSVQQRIKTEILFKSIARAEGIEVSAEELETEIARRAAEAHREVEEFKQDLEEKNQLDGIQDHLKYEKVKNFLIASAVVIEGDQPEANTAAEGTV
jgi:trigger factor